MSEIARIGPFVVDVEGCRLSREGRDVALQPRAFDLLVHLLRNPDVLLPRDDLLETLWPDVFVGGEALNQMVRRLRRALEDDARNPRFLATVPRRGYRFVAEVRWEGAGAVGGTGTVGTVGTVGIAGSTGSAGSPAPLDDDPTPFFGRDEELAALAARAASGARLVTLLGPGGAGKTRLSRRFAAGGDWPGGRWFIDLSESADLESLCHAVSVALGVPVAGGGEAAAAQLGRALAARGRALFVLDNFESVIELAESAVGGWLGLAPDALFLVTSRVRLKLRGEEVIVLGPLDVEAARALFRDRARAAGARLETDGPEEMDGLIADLDGAPLAIELAAGRAGVMGVAQLRERLGRSLKLLRSTHTDAPSRHRSLRAVIEDSVERLAPEERAALRQLSALSGVLSLETAEALLEGDPDAPWALDRLQDLCDQSVIQARALAPGRWGFLVPGVVRRFMAEGGLPEATRERARAVLRERLSELLRDAPEDPELEGLLAAVMGEAGRCQDGDWLAGVALTASGWLRERGPVVSAQRLLDRALALEVPPPMRARLLIARAEADRAGAAGWLERASALADRHGLESLALEVAIRRLSARAVAGSAGDPDDGDGELLGRAQAMGRADLEVMARIALAIAARHGARYIESWEHISGARGIADERAAALGIDLRARLEDLTALGLSERGDYEGAVRHYQRAHALYGRLGWRRRQAAVLSNLSSPLSFSGRLPEALEGLEAARETFRVFGDVLGQAVIETNLSLNYLLAGRLDEAGVAIDSGRALMETTGFSDGLATLALNSASLSWLRGDMDGALAHCASGLALAEAKGLIARAVMLNGWRAGVLAEQGEVEAAHACLTAARAGLSGGHGGRPHAALEVIDCMVAKAECRGEGMDEALKVAIARLRTSREPTVRLLLPLLDRAP